MVLTGVIEQFLHPPISAMTREAIAGGPFTSFQGFTRPRPGVNVDAFGIQYELVSAPAGYGHVTVLGGELYSVPLLALKVFHELLDSTSVVDQEADFRLSKGYILFNLSFPALVTAEMSPGVFCDFHWLLTL
jgi:hypothetical protein